MKFRFIQIFLLITVLVSANSWAIDDNRAITCFNSLKRLIKHQEPGFFDGLNFRNSQTLSEVEHKLGDINLIEYRNMLGDSDILDFNNLTFKMLSQEGHRQNTNVSEGLALEEIEDIFEGLKRSSDLSEKGVAEKKCSTIGFCFGRASMVHFETIARSIPSDSVRKVWMIGNVRGWKYHVATMIRSGRDWYVLDKNSGLKKVNDWVSLYNEEAASNHKPLLYVVSRPSRDSFLDSSTYAARNLFSPRHLDQFEGYFYRFFEDLNDRLENK